MLWRKYVFVKKLLLLCAVCCKLLPVTAQTTTEEKIENLGQQEAVTEDDGWLLHLEQYQQHPLNLNTATLADLEELGLLNPQQINNLLHHRKLLGPLISMYELQAVPGWDIETIKKLLPYITIASVKSLTGQLLQRFKKGEHSLLFRVGQSLAQNDAYQKDSTGKADYAGSPLKIFTRYRYQYKNLLQYGVLAEKDAGEQFGKGKQKTGFDFYSTHLVIRNLGPVKLLAIGDYTVNLGQGLLQWQSLAFKKGPDVLNIKRQGPIIRPYQSAGENNFCRGAAVTLGKGAFQYTTFASYRRLDAVIKTDSSANYFSSIQTSGLHRTSSEQAAQDAVAQITWGSSLQWRKRQLAVGANFLQQRFSVPLIKEVQPYNFYALNGKSVTNAGVEFSYTYKNAHIFGEAATGVKGKALLVGLMASTSAWTDIALLYRNISTGYHTLYGNAFTESTLPTNEKGFYAALSVRPMYSLRLDVYADFFRFPWLRYQVDGPSIGSEYMVQLTYKPTKQVELYSRYRFENKAANDNSTARPVSSPAQRTRQNWRLHINYKISQQFTLRSRAELVHTRLGSQPAEEGFLLYADLLYKPLLKPLSVVLRGQYFDANSYQSRIYAWENDLQYSFSVPFFYGKGYRFYTVIQYKYSRKLSGWLRYGITTFLDKELIINRLEEGQRPALPDIRVQIQYRF